MSQVVVSAPSACLLVPADVFVGADDVEGVAERVVDDLGGAACGIFFRADEEGGGDEAGGVELVGEVDHGGEVFGAGFGVGVSLATDQRMMEALLRSRRIISPSCCLDLARTAGLSNWRAQ